MADALAPAGWYPDSQTPNILRWWDGQAWTEHTAPVEAPAASPSPAPQMPAQVEPSAVSSPVAATGPAPEPRHRGSLFGGKRELEEEVAELRQTLAELGVTERDQLRTELVDLNNQVPTLRHERDELDAAVGPLRTEVADLRIKQEELTSIRSQIQTLQISEVRTRWADGGTERADREDHGCRDAVRRDFTTRRRDSGDGDPPRGRDLRVPTPTRRCPGLQGTA